MLQNTETDVASIGVRLLDDAYLAWLSAEGEAENALQAWFQATGGRRDMAFVTYQAAIDREEASARDLARLWNIATPSRAAVVEDTESVAE